MIAGNSSTPLLTLRRVTGLAILAAIALFNTWLLFAYKLPGKSEFWVALHESGHGLIFLALSLSLCVVFHVFIFQSTNRLIIVTVLGCIAFGGAVELVQPSVGRSASWSDFWRDMLGICAGVSLYLSWILRRAWRWVFIALALILVCVDLYEPYKVLQAGRARTKLFPVIANFDHQALNFFVHAASTAKVSYQTAPPGWPENNTLVAKLEQFPGDWPALYISEVYPDWRGYNSLELEFYNPQQDVVRITVRIHDSHHNHQYNDRYNKTFKLAPGLQRVEIPLAAVQHAPKQRETDMQSLRGIIIYSYKLDTQRTLYIDNIQLR